MPNFINPFTDAGFKRIFGCEVNKDLLMHFLNLLLVDRYVISDVTFLNKERLPDEVDGRLIIYDVFCKTDNGETIIVEMQNARQAFFKKRAIYYVSRAISEQGLPGDKWVYDVKAVIGVFFLNFANKGDVKFKTDVMLMDIDDNNVFSNSIFMSFLCLPLFTKELDECENDFERWIYILRNMDKLERMPASLQDAVWKRLFGVCDVRKMSKSEYAVYEHSLKAYRDIRSNEMYWIQQNELGRAEGRAEGLEEGRAEGRAEGLEEGRKAGMSEGDSKRARIMAKSMKDLGIQVGDIVKCSGLTQEEVEAL